jgi:hypothetical protein
MVVALSTTSQVLVMNKVGGNPLRSEYSGDKTGSLELAEPI